jgi:hypothetical protein
MRDVLGCALFRPPQLASAGIRTGRGAAATATSAARSGQSLPPQPSPRLVSTLPSPLPRRTTSDGVRSVEDAALYATAHHAAKRHDS